MSAAEPTPVCASSAADSEIPAAGTSVSKPIPHDARLGIVIEPGMQLEMGTIEGNFAQVAIFLPGTLRVTFALVCSGILPLYRWERACKLLVQRYPLLQTCIVKADAFVLQVNADTVIPIVVHDKPASQWKDVWHVVEHVGGERRAGHMGSFLSLNPVVVCLCFPRRRTLRGRH